MSFDQVPNGGSLASLVQAQADADAAQLAAQLAPAGTYFPFTIDPNLVTDSCTHAANRCHYARARGGGWVASLGLRVTTQAGNVAVAVYRNAGRGRHAFPSWLMATSGIVSCPAAAYTEIALDAPVYVYPGDWFALWGDNASLKFMGQSSSETGTGLTDSICEGIGFYQDTLTTGPPATTNPTRAGQAQIPCLIGIPPADQVVLLTATEAYEINGIEEPNVYEDNAGLWNLVYHGESAASVESIVWATCATVDGAYAKQGAVLGAADYVAGRPSTLYDNGSIYIFYPDSSTGALNCAVGVTPASLVVHRAVFAPTGGDPAQAIQNTAVINDNGVYRMLFEIKVGGYWRLGSAHAATPLGPWTQDALPITSLQLPVDAAGLGGCGGPWLAKTPDGRYVCWMHASGVASMNTPNDIYRAVSDDFATWILDPRCVIGRSNYNAHPALMPIGDPTAAVIGQAANGEDIVRVIWAEYPTYANNILARFVINDPIYMPLTL